MSELGGPPPEKDFSEEKQDAHVQDESKTSMPPPVSESESPPVKGGKWVKGMTPVGARKPWEKGFVPNPAGRPKGSESTERKIKRFFDMKMKVKDPLSQAKEHLKEVVELSIQDLIIIAQIKKALGGDMGSAEWLHSRGFGKMIQQQSISVNAAHNLRYTTELATYADFEREMAGIEAEEKALDEEYASLRIAEKAEYEEVK